MIKIFAFVQMIVMAGSLSLFSQIPDKSTLLKGANFIPTKTYSAADDARILELYKDLRVADVSDGMDMVGLPGTGLVDPAIHSDWVDLTGFSHVIRGIALRVRILESGRGISTTPIPQRHLPTLSVREASLSLMMSKTVISVL
jgi:hypothetical protein